MDRSLDIQKMLSPMRSLVRALEDEHAGLAVVRADGTWQLEQNGAVRLQATPLPRELAASLVTAVHRSGPCCCLTNWWLRPLGGGTNSTILFERRPDIEYTGLSEHTLELLRTRLVRNANGVIFGDHGPARSGLLLSLTRFLPQELIVYIGPRPPISPPNVTLLHIAPPRDDRDRRQLSDLLDSASAVLFDGPIQRADFRLLFPSSGVSNRWLAHDTTSPQRWISDLRLSPSDQAPITTNIGVRGSSILPIRLTYLATRENSTWNVLLDHDGLHNPSDHNTPPPIRSNLRDRGVSAQLTSPVIYGDPGASPSPELTNPSPTRATGPRDKTIADPLPDEESDFDITSLLDDEGVEDIALLMESGEINVPGFVSRRQEAILEQNKTAADRAEIADAPTSMLRGDRMDTHLPTMIAADDIDDVEIPEVDPAQLRRTMEGSLDTIQMEQNRTLREESMAQNIKPSQPTHSDAATLPDDEYDLEEIRVEEIELDMVPVSDEADTPEPAERPRRILKKSPPSGSLPRRVDRSSELSPDKSGQWRRVSQTSQRVLPIPSSSSDSSPTTNLHPTRTSASEDLDATVTSVPKKELTDELDLGGILDDLKKRRKKTDD